MLLPFENNFTSRFAWQVFKEQSLPNWGVYAHVNSGFLPEKYIDSAHLRGHKCQRLPRFTDPKEVFKLYKSYVLKTGLSDFPAYFDLAGTFKTDQTFNEINLLSQNTEWMFEDKPLKKTDALFNILKKKSFKDFKKQYIVQNQFFNPEFYDFMIKDLQNLFEANTKNLVTSGTIYDNYLFYIEKMHLQINARGLAWLNDFRNFYCPGMLYSFACKHLLQRITNRKLNEKNETQIPFFDQTLKRFPKVKPEKWNLKNLPNLNSYYYPFIENKIGEMLAKTSEIVYYDYKTLVKIYAKAKKRNVAAMSTMLKWTAFEIWREEVE
jgi:hypothetical protein